MDVKIENTWKQQLNQEFEKQYFEKLTSFVKEQYRTQAVYPPAKEIFNAFQHTPFHQVKVVILGQDPYHNVGQANGLAFSVNPGIQIPPSLLNIYKQIHAEYGTPIPTSGDLTRWADQGVLLLNATLTVQAHQAASHQGKGWETFTDAAISTLAANRSHIVFMLWGTYAQKKATYIDPTKHLILQSPHPSPLSAHRGFLGNQHFSQANEYLREQGLKTIEW
ncbi:MAG: uracil-DNA glycosylase [Bacteroidota bacterium]|jgi:uracil-DNA glycosylase